MTDYGTPGSFPTPPSPPSSGARTGPPWEQPGAFFQRWLDTAKLILSDPMNGFDNVPPYRWAGRASDLLAFGAVPFLMVSLLLLIGVGGSMMGGGDAAAGAMIGGIVMMMLFIVIAIVVGFFVITGIVHLACRCSAVPTMASRRRRGPLPTPTAASPLWPRPFCGALAGIFKSFCAIMGLAEMQDTTPVKAAIAILSPMLLCCVLGSCSGPPSWRC